MEQIKPHDTETWGSALIETAMRLLDLAMIAFYTFIIVRSNYNLAVIFAVSALTAWVYTLKICNLLKK
jgi:hypothetical protein